MNVFLWVIVPYLCLADVRRRPHLALPLRQVRLDHPVAPALRGPAAAHRQPAVPLRDARRRRRARDRSARPGVVDRCGRRSTRRSTTTSRSSAACSRASLTLVGPRHPHLPAAHRRPGLLGDHAMDKVMYVFLGAVIVLGHVEHDRRVDLRLGGQYDYREGVSVWFRSILAFQPHAEADGRGAVRVPAARAGRVRAVRGGRSPGSCTCSRAPVGYLTRPYIVYRCRDDAAGRTGPRRGWDRVG